MDLYRPILTALALLLNLPQLNLVEAWKPEDDLPIQLAVVMPYKLYPILMNPFQITNYEAQPVIHKALEDLMPKLGINAAEMFVKTDVDGECSDIMAPAKAVKLYKNNQVDGFLGLVCDFAVSPIARLAPEWGNHGMGMPVISIGAFHHSFDQKQGRYSTLTRIAGTYKQIGYVVADILVKYKYEHVAFIYPRVRKDHVPPRAPLHTHCHFILMAIETYIDKRELLKKPPPGTQRGVAFYYYYNSTRVRNLVKQTSMKANGKF